ncbi:unnamed protein product [Sphagnum troendelagicum]|uniref:Uncharacterized protein n=1 Tax=Sphagnum troendelagicum TaxID=128251 RepID=A0ABP0UP44_9BRYO
MEALLPIELEVMTLRTATTMRLPLDESQHHRLLQLNELDELQLNAYQSIEVAQTQQKKAFDKKVFADNGSYELENVDGSPYPDRINHDKLKKVLDM